TFGDAFLNRELWSETDEEAIRVDDEQIAGLERKTALEQNGFRVGQIGGLLPSKLQDLLTSTRCCQTRRIQKHAGRETTLTCGSPWPHCRCRFVHDDRSATLEMDKAQCEFTVVPTLADEGRIHLRFTPRIKHGEGEMAFMTMRDSDGQLHWGRQEHQAEEVYPWLSWTLTVAPNEYVVLGAVLENGATLGEHFFLTREDDHPIVQRLLVLRATHVPTPAGPIEASLGPCPPLALRASLITARGSCE
ncbi:MAG: hypothetical protein ACRELG_29585, partial [Gemmataceae bacterium]